MINTFYDVSGNIVSSIYDIDGNLLSDLPFTDNATIASVFTSSTALQPQGGCMDDDGNVYAIFYKGGQFRKYNISTGVETVFQTFSDEEYGHANGMTYNPNTGYFYVASQNETGEVYVLDATFNLVDTLYARDVSNNIVNCWNICYDRSEQCFIHFSQGIIYFRDDNFDLLKTESYNVDDWALTRQDIETDGEYIYCLSWNPNKICIFDMHGNLVKQVSCTDFTGESEAICYDWDTGDFYIEGKDTYYVIREAVFKSS